MLYLKIIIVGVFLFDNHTNNNESKLGVMLCNGITVSPRNLAVHIILLPKNIEKYMNTDIYNIYNTYTKSFE